MPAESELLDFVFSVEVRVETFLSVHGHVVLCEVHCYNGRARDHEF